MERLRALGANLELVPGLLATFVFIVWGFVDGGFAPTAWYPGALFLLGLLVATAIAWRGQEIPVLSVLATGCLVGFALWSFVSIAWAGAQGDAWDGANRALLYLTVFALFALPAWRVSRVGSAGIAGTIASPSQASARNRSGARIT